LLSYFVYTTSIIVNRKTWHCFISRIDSHFIIARSFAPTHDSSSPSHFPYIRLCLHPDTVACDLEKRAQIEGLDRRFDENILLFVSCLDL